MKYDQSAKWLNFNFYQTKPHSFGPTVQTTFLLLLPQSLVVRDLCFSFSSSTHPFHTHRPLSSTTAQSLLLLLFLPLLLLSYTCIRYTLFDTRRSLLLATCPKHCRLLSRTFLNTSIAPVISLILSFSIPSYLYST